jgi:hypothetical protein
MRCTGLALAPKLLMLSAILCATIIAGCARHPDKQVAAIAPAQPEAAACRSVDALLEPQPAPDCEFRGPDLKTVDPDQFARLKLDYERQCYRRAEKMARDRLRLLQASKECATRPVRHAPALIR